MPYEYFKSVPDISAEKGENSSVFGNDEIIFDINYKRSDRHRARSHRTEIKTNNNYYNVSCRVSFGFRDCRYNRGFSTFPK